MLADTSSVFRWADHGADTEFDVPLHVLLGGHNEAPRQKRQEHAEVAGDAAVEVLGAPGHADTPVMPIVSVLEAAGGTPPVQVQAADRNECTAFDLEMVAAAVAAETSKLGEP